jgi:hypothetical protein
MSFDLTHVLSDLKVLLPFMELAKLPTQREKLKRLFVDEVNEYLPIVL